MKKDIDFLNWCILAITIVCMITNIFLNSKYIWLLACLFLGGFVYRQFSKNVWKRNRENLVFLNVTQDARKFVKVTFNNMTNKKDKWFICPNCKQIAKVPKKRGNIEITCPKCNSRYCGKS